MQRRGPQGEPHKSVTHHTKHSHSSSPTNQKNLLHNNSAKTAGHASSAKTQACTVQTFPEKGGRTANGSRQPASTAGETKSNVIQNVRAAGVSGVGCNASTGHAGVLRKAWGTPVLCVGQGKLRMKSSGRMEQPIWRRTVSFTLMMCVTVGVVSHYLFPSHRVCANERSVQPPNHPGILTTGIR